jgi:branched-chain amino acid transport system ATP-binding protein
MTALLDIAGVSKRYGGVLALDGVTFRVERGQIKGLIGPNGAGKTSLFNCVCGVLRVDGGHIRYAGRDLHGLRPHRRARMGIARTFQTLELFRELTVLENLMVPVDARSPRGMVADALRLPRARFEEHRADERARALLHFLGIADAAGVPGGDLPIGIQRRVELGRALALRPTLLLLDEPAAGLDSRETADLAGVLSRIRERFGTTMLLVDHDMSLVMRVCDDIAVLDYGRLIAEGPPERIREDPAVVRAYLGESAA